MKKLFLISFFALAVFSLIALLFFTVRQTLANREIEAEWVAALPDAPVLATTSRLEIIPLYEEASTGEEFVIGHGVSYLIYTDSATILLDVGNNPNQLAVAPFVQNMQALGISPEEIDAIVISHPHPDHVGGVEAWKQDSISFDGFSNEQVDLPIYVPSPMKNQGVILDPEPVSLSPDMSTTGIISYPEVYPLSLSEPKGGEQALVVNVAGEGLVLITGCGHPTLEKLVTRAEALYGLPVVGVVGGLHYEGATTEDVQPHIQFLEPRQPKLVALSPHDSSPQALEAFQSAFPEAYQVIQVGGKIQFP